MKPGPRVGAARLPGPGSPRRSLLVPSCTAQLDRQRCHGEGIRRGRETARSCEWSLARTVLPLSLRLVFCPCQSKWGSNKLRNAECEKDESLIRNLQSAFRNIRAVFLKEVRTLTSSYGLTHPVRR